MMSQKDEPPAGIPRHRPKDGLPPVGERGKSEETAKRRLLRWVLALSCQRLCFSLVSIPLSALQRRFGRSFLHLGARKAISGDDTFLRGGGRFGPWLRKVRLGSGGKEWRALP